MITLHIVGLFYYVSYVSTFSSRSLKGVANYLIVIKSFIYDLLSVLCVVFMSVKSRPYRPPSLFFVYNFSDIFIQIVFLVKMVQYMPTRYKIQQTEGSFGVYFRVL